MKIDVPEALRATGTIDEIVALGPFAMEHNGEMTLGGRLTEVAPGLYTVDDMSNAFEFGDGYVAETSGDTLTFRNDQAESVFVMRPLELTDVEWAFPEGTDAPADLETLDEMASEMFAGNWQPPEVKALTSAGEPIDQDHMFMTLDDNDKVLELARSDETGIYVRSNGGWFRIDANATEEDQPTIWNREWVDVDPNAVAVFDASESDQSELKRTDFEKYIIAQ